MNEYTKDALFNFRRASLMLSGEPSEEAIQDAIIQFAFGAERIFKSILYDVNPIFLLEGAGFENVLGVLYAIKLIPKNREKVIKESTRQNGFNRNLLPFKGSMLRSANFSQTVEDNIGAFTKLSDLRGIIAHRSLSELNRDDAWRFVLRLFYPTIKRLATELGFTIREAIGGGDAMKLSEISAKIIAEDKLKEQMDKLLQDHLKQWQDRSNDAAYLAKARRETDNLLDQDNNSDEMATEIQCPACKNDALLMIEADWDVEGSSGEGYMTGVYVSGLRCRFCGLEVNDYEQFDYLRLNEKLSES